MPTPDDHYKPMDEDTREMILEAVTERTDHRRVPGSTYQEMRERAREKFLQEMDEEAASHG